MRTRHPDYYVHPETGKRFQILERRPWTMAATKTVAAVTNGQRFAARDLLHSQSDPFEIHEVTCRVTTLSVSGVPQTDPTLISIPEAWVLMSIKQAESPRPITKSPQYLTTLFEYNSTRGASGFWLWEEPQTLTKSQGYDIVVDNAITAAKAAGGVRVELAFNGFLLTLGREVKE